MLDLPRLQRLHLSARPRFQRAIALSVLVPNYHLPPRVRIRFEGASRLGSEPVIFAMNHTDRYNYWPFQYQLWRDFDRYTATWVKGKYYEQPLVAWFMEHANNLPTVSRGYLITKDFVATVGRKPGDAEYAALRGLVNAAAKGEPTAASPDIPPEVLERPREILGRRFEPSVESYGECMEQLYRAMMGRFVELHREAFDKRLDLLVFPQGTRSIQLSRGHIGLAQIALRFRKTVVPVGCNGSDQLYPGGAPIARGGEVVYRFGEPLRYEDAADFHVPAFEPFTAEAEQLHRERFQGYVDEIMRRIDGLLDARYRFADGEASDGVAGSDRFV